MALLRRLDTVTQHTRPQAHVYTPMSTHTQHILTASHFLSYPVLTATVAHSRTRDVRCGNRVHPRLTSLTPAETQEKFLVQITSLLPKPRPLSGLGIEDGEDLRGFLGPGKVESAGEWGPAAGSPLTPLPWGCWGS